MLRMPIGEVQFMGLMDIAGAGEKFIIRNFVTCLMKHFLCNAVSHSVSIT